MNAHIRLDDSASCQYHAEHQVNVQVAPSFLDSPGSSMASCMQPVKDPVEDVVSRPVTIAFCSLDRSCLAAGRESLDASRFDHSRVNMLNEFRSCVRTTLILLGGIECQEKEGTISKQQPLRAGMHCSFACSPAPALLNTIS